MTDAIATVRAVIVAAALSHGLSPEAMDRMAFCESSWNPRAVGGGGEYHGLYQLGAHKRRQFRARGYDNVWDAAQQANFTAELLAEGEYSAWPVCARHFRLVTP